MKDVKAIEELILHYAPKFMKILKLKPSSIVLTMLAPGQKILEHPLDGTKINCTSYTAFTLGLKNKETKKYFKSYIYFNPSNIVNKKDVIVTVAHELLHVKFFKYEGKPLSSMAEEHFIRQIEQLMLEVMK